MEIENDPFTLIRTEMIELLVKLSRETVRFAAGLAYRSPQRLVDAEKWPACCPAGELRDGLTSLENSWSRRDLEQTSVHSSRLSPYGEQQDTSDEAAHAYELDRIMFLMEDCISAIAGEESTKEMWDRLLEQPAGPFVVLTDSVDGTTIMRTLRTGFSNNMGLYQSLGDGMFKPLAFIATTSTLETQVIDLTTNAVTMIGPEDQQIVITDQDPRDAAMPGSVALVAARGEARHEYKDLLLPDLDLGLPPRDYGGRVRYNPPPDIFTIGGAPIIAVFSISELQYAVIPHDQAPYDAWPLLGALLAGHHYYLLSDGSEVTAQTVSDWLSIVTGPHGSHPRPVKAGVLVREGADPAVTQKLLAALRQSLPIE